MCLGRNKNGPQYKNDREANELNRAPRIGNAQRREAANVEAAANREEERVNRERRELRRREEVERVNRGRELHRTANLRMAAVLNNPIFEPDTSPFSPNQNVQRIIWEAAHRIRDPFVFNLNSAGARLQHELWLESSTSNIQRRNRGPSTYIFPLQTRTPV